MHRSVLAIFENNSTYTDTYSAYSVSKIMDSFLLVFLCWLNQEVMSRAQIIILHGHQLSAGHHYAMALIMQRCNELRHYCDTLNAALKTKHTRLLQTHQLLLCLEQVLRRVSTHTHTNTRQHSQIFFQRYTCVLHLQAHTWCDDGAYLLANQLIDKYQSKEGAQAALRDIEQFLEGAPSMLSLGPDILAIEYEAVITPQLQVSDHNNHFLTENNFEIFRPST